MNIHEEFGQTVAALRKEKGYSQERFAFEAGIARKYMSDIENLDLINLDDMVKEVYTRKKEK